MRFTSFLVSILLHAGLLGLALFWVSSAAPRLGPPVYVVDILPPAPLGTPEGTSTAAAPAPTPAAPAPTPVPPVAPEPPAAPEPVAIPEPPKPEPTPVPEPPKPEPVAIPEPPKPEPPKPVPPKPEPPKPAPPKPTPPKPEPPKPTPPKPEPPKPKPPTAEEILRNALADAERQANPPKPQTGANSGDPVARALAEAGAQANAQSPRGRPDGVAGGQGNAPEAGIGAIYGAQIRAVVRPNWKFIPQARHRNMRVVVRIDIGPGGEVLNSRIINGSGDARMDSSVLEAIAATGTLPPPPSPDIRSVDVTFLPSDTSGSRG